MQHPDEGMIHTWLDGELSPEDAAAFEEHIATCPQCAAAVAEARGLVAASSRIVSALDNVPAGVIPIAKPQAKAWYSSAQFRAAAAVLVVAGASLLVFRNENQNGATIIQRAASTAEKKTTPEVAPMAAPADSTPFAKGQPTIVERDASTSGSVANAPTAPSLKAPTIAASKPATTASPPPVADAVTRGYTLPRAKDEDFSGKGVKGGTAYGVAGVADSASAQSQRAGVARMAEEPRAANVLQGKVAGVGDPARKAAAVGPMIMTGIAAAPANSAAKLIRIDSARSPKQSFYETPSGAKLVLTEIESPGFATISKESASTTGDGKAIARLRPPSVVSSVSPPTTSAVLDPMIPVPAAVAPSTAAKATINTITWFDASGLRRYVLTGPVSVAELEAVKAQIQRTSQ